MPHPATIAILARATHADPEPLLLLRREALLAPYVPADQPGLTREAMAQRLGRSCEGLRVRSRRPTPHRVLARRTGLSEAVVAARMQGRWLRTRYAAVMEAELVALLRALGVPAVLHYLWVVPARRAWDRAMRLRLDSACPGRYRRR